MTYVGRKKNVRMPSRLEVDPRDDEPEESVAGLSWVIFSQGKVFVLPGCNSPGFVE